MKYLLLFLLLPSVCYAEEKTVWVDDYGDGTARITNSENKDSTFVFYGANRIIQQRKDPTTSEQWGRKFSELANGKDDSQDEDSDEREDRDN